MIRPFTCICMLLAGGSGLYLYQSKHRVQLLDREIAAAMRAADHARERAGVLRAEWTLLNDPERLSQLAGQFLSLKTVTPGQFTSLAELDRRLPPPRSLDSDSSTDLPEEPENTPIAQAPEPLPSLLATAKETKPLTPAAATPVKVLVASPPRAPERQAERPPERKPPPTFAQSHPREPRELRAATTPVVQPVSMSASVRRPLAPQYSAMAAPAPVNTGGSALGMARSLAAPPVPVAPTNPNYWTGG